ncbi:substrate-binding domain-containing protein [Mucilaginibacter sp. SMC90]|uniref:molybdate ABC transporter substrate-binding protein n=1 Tax=Mucilaginibacter TaxID=423349 RepID=UPI00131A82F3|nr:MULTISPECIES: substrate-binding domain-containing protein [unclassified Mucilaginibacter]MBS7565696.1 substrate-binding domain-containing protein [Mucilaginibacter sp. Bleaf8]UOE49841.1 substrate-binding domain-containing protein [Mucilaginibacter sp. SMC90]
MKYLQKITFAITAIIALGSQAKAQDHRFDPPWNTPPESKVQFTVPGVDNVPDLFGDINDPQLVVFFAGNQFMCIDDLMSAFKKQYPQYQRVFAETLPPGILAKQIMGGSIVIGNMRITLKPDVYTAGKSRIDQMPEYFSKTAPYAYNRLAIMVQKGNPKKVKGLKDLGRNDVRVSMPNPEWEGIGKRIEEAYVKVGGETLKNTIMDTKVKNGKTFLTQIHHRQTPMRIMYQQSDAAPVWFTEAYYQKMIGHPTDMVEIPEGENISATYVAGQLKTAPHAQAAQDFMDFLVSPTAKAIYKKYGFITK